MLLRMTIPVWVQQLWTALARASRTAGTSIDHLIPEDVYCDESDGMVAGCAGSRGNIGAWILVRSRQRGESGKFFKRKRCGVSIDRGERYQFAAGVSTRHENSLCIPGSYGRRIDAAVQLPVPLRRARSGDSADELCDGFGASISLQDGSTRASARSHACPQEQNSARVGHPLLAIRVACLRGLALREFRSWRRRLFLQSDRLPRGSG